MGILGKLFDFIGGGVFDKITDTITEYFPPSMSDQEKAAMELALQKVIGDQKAEAARLIAEANAQLDKRISEQEGTASDLKQLPLIGRIVIFLRGTQRPIWGFLTMYLDCQWFTGSLGDLTQQQQTALIVINVLVLGFLFGERTIKNLEPLIVRVFGGK